MNGVIYVVFCVSMYVICKYWQDAKLLCSRSINEMESMDDASLSHELCGSNKEKYYYLSGSFKNKMISKCKF